MSGNNNFDKAKAWMRKNAFVLAQFIVFWILALIVFGVFYYNSEFPKTENFSGADWTLGGLVIVLLIGPFFSTIKGLGFELSNKIDTVKKNVEEFQQQLSNISATQQIKINQIFPKSSSKVIKQEKEETIIVVNSDYSRTKRNRKKLWSWNERQ